MPRWLKALLLGAYTVAKAARRSRLLKGKGVDEVIAGIDEAIKVLKEKDEPKPAQPSSPSPIPPRKEF